MELITRLEQDIIRGCKSMRGHKKGFTLIEIIVVLVIIGVLATMSISAYFSWILKSKAAEAFVTMKTMKDEGLACRMVHVGQESLCDRTILTTHFNVSMASTINPQEWIITAAYLPTMQAGAVKDGITLQGIASGNGTCSTIGQFRGVC